MFCYQCQETSRNGGCEDRGVCGKDEETANLQDLLLYVLKGLSVTCGAAGDTDRETGRFVVEGLFTTITNANFHKERFRALIAEGLGIRDQLKRAHGLNGELHDCAGWSPGSGEDYLPKAETVGVLSTENEDVRSLRELLVYASKGIAAYAHHASALGAEDDEIYRKLVDYLASTTQDLSVDEMIARVLDAGETTVKVMALLDGAHTRAYGNPEITEVNLGVGDKPGILISGHDLKDLEELLEQTKGTGVDVYTHCEMLPGHYYPAFKKHDHFVGHYGNAWYQQKSEFEKFNGPILMTTNCLVPPKDSYRDRLFTTSVTGFAGVKHVAGSGNGAPKDFSELIELARGCDPPTEIENGKLVGGFAHSQVLALADKVVEAVKSGAIKRFVVMAGCDGRHKERSYFTEVAETLPEDTVILTAGCAKFRYNKLDHGDIGGIPRLLDAGQCNDCYSLAVIALKLKEVFELEDINELPLSFDIGWFEQKAAAVLLALLHLGVKGIRLGPTLPAFLSPGVAKVLVENFDIKLTGTPGEDIELMMQGK
ncbi:MAG: hydroxylamine reductase [Planctomycetaceae bacterium]|nr:hydroxylamine reductase [Planctomycetaceae bacterium]